MNAGSGNIIRMHNNFVLEEAGGQTAIKALMAITGQKMEMMPNKHVSGRPENR